MYTRYSLFASLALSRSALFLPSFHSFSNARIYMLRANFFVAFFEILPCAFYFITFGTKIFVMVQGLGFWGILKTEKRQKELINKTETESESQRE
jgi:predicted membrane protein